MLGAKYRLLCAVKLTLAVYRLPAVNSLPVSSSPLWSNQSIVPVKPLPDTLLCTLWVKCDGRRVDGRTFGGIMLIFTVLIRVYPAGGVKLSPGWPGFGDGAGLGGGVKVGLSIGGGTWGA